MFKLLLIIFCVSIIVWLYFPSLWKDKFAWLTQLADRKNPKLPGDRPTMYHVRELLLRHEKDKAIQVYCEIFKVDKKVAKKAVDELERSIQEKH